MTDPVAGLNAALEGRYRIERKLGEGGMATVYLSRDLRHGRSVAIKVLRPELTMAVGAERFLAEIETTAGLRHPHILPLFDSGEALGLLFYVMPLVEGESLRERLEREGPLPLEDALSITKDVAAALGYAHGHGVVHRDIKPANILLQDGEALVADFGIARAFEGGTAHLTATGVSLGTPSYMSPEQIGGEATLDGRSDVYALGCLLYEMLTGEPPFTGSTTQAVVARALSEPAPSVRDRRPDVPKPVAAAIRRALAKRPEERFAAARDFYEACATPANPPPRRASRPIVLAGAAAVAVIGFLGWRALQTANARALLPEIGRLAEAGQFVEAYEVAVRAERWIGADTLLAAHFDTVADLLTVTSEPEGAQVIVERLPSDSTGVIESQLIGVTPVVGHRLPRADHRVVLRLDGFVPLERMVSSSLGRADLFPRPWELTVHAILVSAERQPADMVAVPGGDYALVSPDAPIGLSATLESFLIDRTEVTNEAFRTFVQAGGYANEAWWPDAPEGERAGFVDRTGLPGPRGWVRQQHGEGEGDFPVTGVNWHEASAYCRSLGRRLPTVFEWEKTARDGVISHKGVIFPWGYVDASGPTTPRANFNSSGPLAVDEFPFGISPYGAYAMAGNVAEWTANAYGDGYAVVGGSWNGPSYLFSEYGSQVPRFTSPAVGFRCARSEGGRDQGAGKIDLDIRTPEYTPVDEATFRTLLQHYRYDRRPTNARGLTTAETAAWTRERLWIDGPEGDSVLLYFYRPKRASPPYQTLVYVPGGSAFFESSIPSELEWSIGPAIQAGRAALGVVLQGMVERGFGPGFEPPEPASVRFRDQMVRHATELRIGVDYLETRDDVDMGRLAYVGLSWGAGSRLALSAVDDRYRAVVYIGGGIDERVKPTLPEADNVNFAPYVRVPKLLLNGRSDEEHPWTTRGLPLWNLLREPKELVLVDGAGHIVPLEHRIPAINGFLDRTLGPVGSR